MRKNKNFENRKTSLYNILIEYASREGINSKAIVSLKPDQDEKNYPLRLDIVFCCLGWCYEQKLDQNHWFSYTNTTEMSPKSPTRASISSTSFWSRIISRYTRTIYASRYLHFRGDISPPKCTYRSHILIKTEAFGKFQLRPREPPYHMDFITL